MKIENRGRDEGNSHQIVGNSYNQLEWESKLAVVCVKENSVYV